MEFKVPASLSAKEVNIAAKCQGCKSNKELVIGGKKWAAGKLKFKCFMGTRVATPAGNKFNGFYVYTDDVDQPLNDAYGVPTEAVCDLALVANGPALVTAPKTVSPTKKDK